MHQKELSIIIPVYNRTDSLTKVLSELAVQKDILSDSEIIIVDDGSTETIKKLIGDFLGKIPNMKYFYQSNKGASAARNLGIKECVGDIILFLDSDIIPSDDLVKEHLEFHKIYTQYNFALRGSTIFYNGQTETARFAEIGFVENINKGVAQPEYVKIKWADFRSSNISIKRKFLLENGFFDEELPAHQDSELGYRLDKKGLILFHSNKALGFHYHPVDLNQYFDYAEKYGKSLAIWYSKLPALKEDLSKIRREHYYGFFSIKRPFVFMKHSVRVLLVNRLTVKFVIFLGNVLKRRNVKYFKQFYSQAYKYYDQKAFKKFMRLIKKRKIKIKREPSICMVCEPLLPEYSGSSIQAILQANYLKKRGMNIFLLASAFVEENVKLKKSGEVDSVRIYTKNNFLGKVIYIVRSFLFLLKYRERYNIIHIQGGGYIAYSAIMAGRILSKKIMLKMSTYTDVPKEFMNSSFGWLKYFLLFKSADLYIGISNLFINAYKEYGLDTKKLVLLPDAVDINKFKPVSEDRKKILRANLELPKDSFLAICVAKIIKRKGIADLLDIWAGSIKVIDNGILILVGPFDTDDLAFVEMIKERVDNFPLKNKVLLFGFKDNIAEYLNASDMFLFTSEKEGLPNAPLQAMSCGLPCVTYELPGITEIIFDNFHDGVVVSRDDKQTFVNNTIKIWKDTQFAEFLGKNARKKVEDNFSEEVVCKKYMQVYNDLINNNEIKLN